MSVNHTQSVVTQVIQSLVDAWNRRDATRFANLFSEEAHYIDGNGRWLKGRRAMRIRALRLNTVKRSHDVTTLQLAFGHRV